MRIALGIEYDGMAFFGWQIQPHQATVQQVVEHALANIAGETVGVVCAGRTDTGVHAIGQVVHFDTTAERPLTAWVKGVNTHLPPTVAVQWACRVPDDFHARFSATGRNYEYWLMNRPVRPALGTGRIGWFHHALDLEAMRAAAAHIEGTHDFSAFRSAECQARSPVRDLRRVAIGREGDIIHFSLAANAFLHHMVRNIVGSLIYVGKGKHRPDWLAEVLHSRERARAAPTFPPHGLYLAGVDYDAKWALPARAAVGVPGRFLT